MQVTITNDVRYIGCDDLDIRMFEGQYHVPEGMSYNSYLIDDEKICVMDTVDQRKTDEWFANLERELAGRKPTYLVSLHQEPDHAANISAFMAKYPECKLVCSKKAVPMLEQFQACHLEERMEIVKEGDTLVLGKHTLAFVEAPMVHWPEVLVAYDTTDKILFAADGFGKFGAIVNETDDWACEARRYYFNICGKYGVQVQNLLKKAAALDIQIIAPLHGPVLTDNLAYYINLYDIWSSYRPETEGVFIAYCSLHGNTAKAAKELAAVLESKGIKVACNNLTCDDVAEAVEDAFRYNRMVLCSPTYDGGIMPVMNNFINLLKSKGYKNRTVALVENGTWAPIAAKNMRKMFEEFNNVNVLEQIVTIRSAMNDDSRAQLNILAEALA